MDVSDTLTKGFAPIARFIFKQLPYLSYFFASIKNYWQRPKLEISLRQTNFQFKDWNNATRDYSFPCIILKNKSKNDFKINPSSIRVNKETYSWCIQSNPIFLRCNDGTSGQKKLTCENTNSIFKFFHENWPQIAQNNAPSLLLPAHEQIFLPLFLYRQPHFILAKASDSKLWFSSRKICLKIQINSIDAEYGINRHRVYENIINWLSFWDQSLAK